MGLWALPLVFFGVEAFFGGQLQNARGCDLPIFHLDLVEVLLQGRRRAVISGVAGSAWLAEVGRIGLRGVRDQVVRLRQSRGADGWRRSGERRGLELMVLCKGRRDQFRRTGHEIVGRTVPTSARVGSPRAGTAVTKLSAART